MTQTTRSNVVSSFTIIKGALILETYSAFRHWDLHKTTAENLDLLRHSNVIGAKSTNWLRDVIFVIQRRFDPDTRDRALVELAVRGCDLETWKPLLLWHMTRDEFLLRHFLVTWLFERYQDDVQLLRTEHVVDYLRSLPDTDALVAPSWSDSTSKRVAAGLLKVAADFGLLRGSSARQFAGYHLPEASFLYLLHAMADELGSPAKAVSALDWRMYLMTRANVESELLRLHQFRKLHYDAAGSVVQLQLPASSAGDFAVGLVS